jgi:hypothetical protein
MRFAVRAGFICVLCSFVLISMAPAQGSTGSVHGQVTDPSGAVVRQATVTVTNANGKKTSVVTDAKGVYEIKGLGSGNYTVQAIAKGFSPEVQDVTIVSGSAKVLDLALTIAVAETKVSIEDDAVAVSTDSSSNASALVIKGKDLDALSDDPDDLQSDLQALAGPSAGPNGGEIYIDGFSNGTLPPKSAIREVRVNQNPFSAQYDRMGFGRVEVFTKPGQDAYHGQFQTMFNHQVFNSRNPYLLPGVEQQPYHTLMFDGSFSGPINSKSSFYLNVERRTFGDVAIVNATVPCGIQGTAASQATACDTHSGVQNLTDNVPTARIRTEISPRIDYQLTPNNTLTVRYQYEGGNSQNNGIGGFNLASQGNNGNDYEHSVRISDTQIINSSTINETRLQITKSHSESIPLIPGMTVQVQDVFTMGGSNSPASSNDQQRYELQNYTSKVIGKHFIRFGGRLRQGSQSVYSLDNALGKIEYRSMGLYQQNLWDKFTFTSGNAGANVSQVDAGLYAEDDFRFRPNMTLSYGLRFETQNNIPNNHFNFAPRIGFAWGLGKGASPKTVLRAGFGTFYDRFSQNNVMQVLRTNGPDAQLNWLITNTTGSTAVPDISTLIAQGPSAQNPAVTYKINPNLKLPYMNQVAATLDRQINNTSSISVSYIVSRGLHQIVMENLGYLEPTPVIGPYEYDTAGTFKQNQLMVNSRVGIGQYLSLMGWYVYGHSNSNATGSFPSTPFDLAADWGRSYFDVRHRGMIMGTINLPKGFRLNPIIAMSSGRPYNVTTGVYSNEDGQRNDRPWFSGACPNGAYATNPACYSLTSTSFGKVPINYLTGPGSFTANLRVSKTFGFGKKQERAQGGPQGGRGALGGPVGPVGPGGHGGGGWHGGMMGGGSSGQKYNLTISASARNLFNTLNKGNPSGDIVSSNFGVSTSTAGGFGPMNASSRRIDLALNFSF